MYTTRNKNIIFTLLVCGGGAGGLLIHNILTEETGNWIDFISTPGNVGLFLISFGLLIMAFTKIKELKQKSGT